MISVIIPAYNVEKTIENAVKSIVDSAMDGDVEIIIVENGSTDNTLEIAIKLKKTYKSIMVYQSQKGVSYARNLGIEKANGEWICFVDADDLLCKDAFRFYYDEIKENDADLYFFSYKKNNKLIIMEENEKKSMKKYICMFLENPTKYLTVWAKLFRRSILQEYKIEFNTDLSMSEDSVFMLEYLAKCSAIAMSKKCVYKYRMYEDSATRTYSGKKKVQYLQALSIAKKVIATYEVDIKKSFRIYTAMQFNLIMVKEIFHIKSGLNLIERINEMKKLLYCEDINKEIESVELRNCFSMRMIPIGMIKMHFYFGAALIYYCRAIINYIRR